MKSKTNRIIWIIAGIIPSLLTTLSGVMKITKADELVKGFTAMGLLNYLTLFGCMELLFMAMFWIPKTHKLSLFLLTGYFGGAIAMELAHGKAPVMPVLILAFFWTSAFVKDRHMFLPHELA